MHRLALEIGGRTVHELGRAMSSSEFSDWIEFEKDEPFGAPWTDYLFARMAQVIVAIKTTKGKPVPKLSKFLYKGPKRKTESDKAAVNSFFEQLDSQAKKPNGTN